MKVLGRLLFGVTALVVPQLAWAQALQAGEIELHIEAMGQVAPDRAELDYNLRGKGETQAEADRALEAASAELRAKLRDLGIRPEAIRVTGGDAEPLPVAEVAIAAPPPGVPPVVPVVPSAAAPAPNGGSTVVAPMRPAPPKPRPTVWSNSRLTVTLTDMAKVAPAMALRSASGGWTTPRMGRYSSDNPAASERRAIELAFADARSKADVYAGAMGYRVVRVLRVSNAKPALNLPDTIRTIANLEGSGGRERAAMQGMSVSIAIDYAIAPK